MPYRLSLNTSLYLMKWLFSNRIVSVRTLFWVQRSQLGKPSKHSNTSTTCLGYNSHFWMFLNRQFHYFVTAFWFVLFCYILDNPIKIVYSLFKCFLACFLWNNPIFCVVRCWYHVIHVSVTYATFLKTKWWTMCWTVIALKISSQLNVFRTV